MRSALVQAVPTSRPKGGRRSAGVALDIVPQFCPKPGNVLRLWLGVFRLCELTWLGCRWLPSAIRSNQAVRLAAPVALPSPVSRSIASYLFGYEGCKMASCAVSFTTCRAKPSKRFDTSSYCAFRALNRSSKERHALASVPDRNTGQVSRLLRRLRIRGPMKKVDRTYSSPQPGSAGCCVWCCGVRPGKLDSRGCRCGSRFSDSDARTPQVTRTTGTSAATTGFLVCGWEAGIRTPISRSRVCRLTVRRPPNGPIQPRILPRLRRPARCAFSLCAFSRLRSSTGQPSASSWPWFRWTPRPPCVEAGHRKAHPRGI